MSDISRQIWEMKHRYTDDKSATVKKTVAKIWSRVAAALSALEREPAYWRRRFKILYQNFASCPPATFLRAPGRAAMSHYSIVSSWEPFLMIWSASSLI